MSKQFEGGFLWLDIDRCSYDGLTDAEKYEKLTSWAGRARGINPGVFDTLTEWMLDDVEWTSDKLEENKRVFMTNVMNRFKEQNEFLCAFLKELEPSGVVNKAVFGTLDYFDGELSGNNRDAKLKQTVHDMLADFSVMADRRVREIIAGQKNGPSGTNAVDYFGYVNVLKDCDASVQFTLFMPGLAKNQQRGFTVESFEYKKLPPMRFVGKELTDDEADDMGTKAEIFRALDALGDFKSGFDYDLFFMHHFGICVDVGPWHGVWGRFMAADAPVPDGFTFIDFLPKLEDSDPAGPPYMSQFTFAVFSGDIDAMHRREGFDCDAMYDVTRNIMLGSDIVIPYPDKYWTAEVFLDGYDKPSTAYMFSAVS